MAATSLSLSLGLPSAAITSRVSTAGNNLNNRHAVFPLHNIITCSASENTCPNQEISGCFTRRPFLLGGGALSLSLLPASPLLAQGTLLYNFDDWRMSLYKILLNQMVSAEKPDNYEIFVDKRDGYSYYYPSDWREFDFRGHDSAFKDRYLQLQNVRLSFIPTDKSDIHDLGAMEEVVPDLVKHVYSAPNQVANIMEMKERSTEGKNYFTFEYVLTSPNFSRAAFATIAIGNGRHYTLIVGANERRWRKFRNKLKVVADSFQVLDI